jgi:hypothetical protein
MTHTEVYAELEKDRENVARWFDHRADEYRRRALKIQKFPVTWWLDYTSPRKNRYLISVTCTRRNYDRFHGLTVLALRREERGYSVYLSYIGKYSLIRRTVFVQHVFDRYADPERGNVQKTGIDLIKHFVDHQSNGYILTDQRLAGRSVRYNGRDHQFIAVNDGVILGDVDNGIFIARTFITYEMATGRQHEEFAYAKNKVNDLEDEIVLVRDSSKQKKFENLITI